MAGQPLKATFFTFHKREKGMLLGASIAFFVVAILLFVAFAVAVWALLGQDFLTLSRQMAEAGAKGSTTPGALPAGFGRIFLIFPLEMVWLVFLFIAMAAFESACLRWMIRGERSGALNLHFGADMWRVYGVYWMWFFYFLGTYILFLILVIAFTAGAAAMGGQDNPLVVGFAALVLSVAWVLGWIYVAVRLAPAGATSIGVREFAPLKAWTVSRGRFWALFGSYFLLFIFYFIAFVVVWMVFFGATYMTAFSNIDWTSAQSDPQGFQQRYSQANASVLQNMFGSPAAIALYIGGQIAGYIVATVFWLLLYGVNARALIAAAQDGKVQAPGVDVAEHFS